MSLIPQDPLLLEMSVRDNLDPTGVAGDDEIWAALELSAVRSSSSFPNMNSTTDKGNS